MLEETAVEAFRRGASDYLVKGGPYTELRKSASGAGGGMTATNSVVDSPLPADKSSEGP